MMDLRQLLDGDTVNREEDNLMPKLKPKKASSLIRGIIIML